MTVLETKDLKKYYGSGDTQVKALDGVDLTVENGESVSLTATGTYWSRAALRSFTYFWTVV